MKILVTGAAGFLGSHLVEHLLKEGHTVFGVDNLSGGSLDNLSFCYENRKRTNPLFTFIQYDCNDFVHIQELCQREKFDLVYHCACLAHEGLSVFSPHLITKSVYNASISVFSAAIASGVKRIVYMSSMARYGHPKRDAVGPLPFWEELQPMPVDPYGIAKVAAEETLKALCETHDVEYTILVPHNIIGTRQNFTDPHRNVVSIMMNRLKQGKDVVIYGDGTQTRCFSPVADNIHCIARTANLADKAINGQVINIGPDKGTISINELSKTVHRIAGKVSDPLRFSDRPREVKHASCSSDKARRMLGYEEQQSLEDCLREMWNAIPENGKPFIYNTKPLEIITDKTPLTWTKQLI